MQQEKSKSIQKLLDDVREKIKQLSDGDPDLLFYYNRFIFARLQLDERQSKKKIKLILFKLKNGNVCSCCNKKLTTLKDIHLHRKDSSKGYSVDNCELLHPACHREIHTAIIDEDFEQNEGYLLKRSKFYHDKPYKYWWDISPSTKEALFNGKYNGITFIQKDTGLFCTIDSGILLKKGFLDLDRQTTRGNGNWGVKVLQNNNNKLLFETANSTQKDLFYDVKWEE